MGKDPKDYGRRGDDLEVKTPFGWAIRAGGRQMSLIVIILMTSGFLAYMIYELRREGTDRSKVNMETLARGQIAVVESTKKMSETIEVMTYVSTLTDAQKQALRLDMPDSLRSKVGQR